MKPRAYITRFGRIISNSDLPEEYKKSKEELEDIPPKDIGPINRQFHADVLSVGLYCNNSLGELLLYPIRETEIYVLTINGKSEICSSNQKLYKKLSKKGFISSNTDAKALFREYRILDLQEISKHIPDSCIKRVPCPDWFIHHLDVTYIATTDKTNHFLLVPCCFEEKTVVEAFFTTESLNSKILEKFDAMKLKQFTSCFNTPADIIQELVEGLNF